MGFQRSVFAAALCLAGGVMPPSTQAQTPGQTIVNVGNNKCLDVEGGVDSRHGLVTRDCNGGTSQSFTINGEEIRVGGLCLDVRSGTNVHDARVITYECHRGTNQKWRFDTNGTLRSMLPGPRRCLDVNHEDRERITLRDCWPTSVDQQFVTAAEGSFTLAVTSDPQYPWSNEGDVPSSGDETSDSQVSIPLVYDSINRYHDTRSPLAGVIVNGDVTAYGHDWQWNYMHRQLGRLKPPVFLGLGNHDYQNNVDDCFQNSCVRNSLNAFDLYLPADAQVDRVVTTIPLISKEYRGSYAWSKTIGGVHFVFLNNEPTYGFRATGGGWLPELMFIHPAIPWLEADLARARAAGQAIVLVYHKPGEFTQADGFTRDQFERIVVKYKVSLVLWGHAHEEGIESQYWVFGNAPALFSGSASTQTYLIARFDPARGYADVYLSKKGNIDDMPLVASVPLRTPVEYLEP